MSPAPFPPPSFLSNFTTSIILLIASIIIIIQTFFLYSYFNNIPDSKFNSITILRNEVINISFNIALFIGGLSLATLLNSVRSLFGKTIGGNLVDLVTAVIITFLLIYIRIRLIDSDISADIPLTDSQVENLDRASAIITFLIGMVLGHFIMRIILDVLEKSEELNKKEGTGVEIISVGAVILLQSIASLTVYFAAEVSDTFYLIFFSIFALIGLGVTIGGIVLTTA